MAAYQKFFLRLLLVTFVLAGNKTLSAQWLETNIQLPPQASARDLIYNPLSNKIYTANVPDVGMPAMRSVSIIDGATNAIITTIQVPEGPRDFCHNTVNNKIYVANYYADSVSVIDGATDQLIAVIPAGDGPRALCYNSRNNRIYCANEFSGNVTIIDGNADTVITTLPVGSTPRVICYNSVSNKVYCPNAGSKSLTIIDGETNTAIATVVTGNVPRGIVFNPQSNKVYCSNYGSDNVTVIDGNSNTVIATVTVGDGPTALFHNPAGNKIYCSNVGAPGPGTPSVCTISVIDGSSNNVIKTLTAGDEPTAFCYSTNYNKIFWVNEWSHNVSVVDAATDSLLQIIALGTPPVQPVDICYNPVNERIYTANRLTYNISVIRDSLNTLDIENVRAWNSDGQVFVVWEFSQQSPLTYNVYMSQDVVSSTTQATKVGSLFEPEWKGKRLTLANPGATWRIPDGKGGAYQLTANEGLYVYTPHAQDTLAQYFYVTRDNDTVLSTANSTSQPVAFTYNPTIEPVKCHLQFTGITSQGFPYSVFAMWTDGRNDPNDSRPDFPVMANAAKNGAPHVFAVYHPQSGLPAGPYPAVVCLHGGGQEGSYWSYAPNSAHYRNTGNVPVDGITIAFDDRLFLANNGVVNEDRPSNWFGWHTQMSATTATNATSNAIVVPYTLRRLMWTIDWLIHASMYNIDSTRIAIMGNSMGGTGTLLLSRWKPERFSAATAFVPPHYTPETAGRLFGTAQTNLRTTVLGPDGIVLRINDFFDPAVRISPVSRDYCLTRIYRGRCDDAAEWGNQHIQLYNDLNNKGLGVHLYWDNRDHTASDWTTDDPKTEGVDIGEWVSPVRTERCAAAYQSRYRSNQSYPGFFNDDQNLSLPGRQPDLGNGDKFNGDPWGTWSGYYDWDLTTLTDSTHKWGCTFFLVGQSAVSVDNFPGDSAKTDVSIRKACNFKPVAGTLLQWIYKRISDNVVLQSGSVSPDSNGLVTVIGLTVYKDPVRARLEISYTSTSINERKSAELPQSLQLQQNYPNPFNPSTTIRFSIPKTSRTKLIVYDLLGREIQTLLDKELEIGFHEIVLDASNYNSGVYFYKIQSGGMEQIKKMIVIK